MIFRLVFDILYWLVCLAWFVWIIRKPLPDLLPKNNFATNSPLSQPVLENSSTFRILNKIWKRPLWAEIIIIAYVGLIFVLGFGLLYPPVAAMLSQPQQSFQVQAIWSVGKNGSGLGEFDAPLGLGVDNEGNIYLADRGNHRLEKFLPDGTPITVWSGDSDGKVPFIEPSGIAIDPNSNLVWVLDAGNGWIYRLQPGGKLEAVIDGSKFGFYNPRGLAISHSGDLFVADTGSARVCQLSPKGELLAQWGNFGTKKLQFQDPVGIAIQGNDIFIADDINQRTVHYDLNGKWIGSWGIQAGSSWLTADNAGHILISNSENGKISIYDLDGKLVGELNPGKELLSMGNLTGIAATKDGRVYVVGENHLAQYKMDWK